MWELTHCHTQNLTALYRTGEGVGVTQAIANITKWTERIKCEKEMTRLNGRMMQVSKVHKFHK